MESAKRTLPRTGIPNVDEEALLLFACLSRIDKSLASVLAEASSLKPMTMAGARGERIDITHRMERGMHLTDADLQPSSNPLVGANDESDASTVIFKSDAAVASAALVRLAQHAGSSLKELQHYREENTRLHAELSSVKQRLQEAQAQLETMNVKLRQCEDPEQLYHLFKSSWSMQHAAGQRAAAESHDEKEAAIQKFVDRRLHVSKKAREVSTFQLLYRTTDELLQREFQDDDGGIQKIVSMFEKSGGQVDSSAKKKGKGSRERELAQKIEALLNPPPFVPLAEPPAGLMSLSRGRVEDTPTAAVAPVDAMDAEEGGDETASPEETAAKIHALINTADLRQLIAPSSEAQLQAKKDARHFLQQVNVDLGKAQRLRLDDFDADTQELNLAVIQRQAQIDMKRARTRATQSVKSASIVVTYYVGTNSRKVSKLDDAGTLMYQLRNVLVEAPTTFSNLVIDMLSAAGKADLLAEQAAKLSLSTIWNDLTLYEQPLVRIQFISGPPNGVTTLQSQLQRDLHFLDLHGDDASSSSASRDRLMRLKFHRVADADGHADEGNPIVTLWNPATSRQTEALLPLVTERQCGGILLFLATRASGHPLSNIPMHWSSPLQSGQVRCLASSMAPGCTADALVRPFVDRRTPFFATEDRPHQSVQFSLDHVVVVPSGYSIASTHPIGGAPYPRSWKLEASLDEQHWVLLRKHEGDNTMNRYNPTFYWDIPRVNTATEPYFKHFRLTQTDVNAHGTHQFCICSVELYGRIMMVDKCEVASAEDLPKMFVSKQKFTCFSQLPVPKVVETAGKKKK